MGLDQLPSEEVKIEPLSVIQRTLTVPLDAPSLLRARLLLLLANPNRPNPEPNPNADPGLANAVFH